MAIISGIKIFGSGSKPPVLEELSVTDNGTYTPSDGVDGFNEVNVNVQPNLQAKSIEIVENGTQTISPDNGYDGLSSVEVSTNVTASMPTLVLQNLIKFKISGDADLRFCDISNMTTMERMFTYCQGLTSLNLSGLDTSKVADMAQMFEGCTALTNLNMKGCNLTNVTAVNNMFKGCTALTELRFTDYGDEHWTTENGDLPKIDLTNWYLEDCVNLSYDSLKSIIWSLNVEYSGTCRIGSINLAKLTDEDIGEATEYGWTLE